jgi:hypothetical protein
VEIIWATDTSNDKRELACADVKIRRPAGAGKQLGKCKGDYYIPNECVKWYIFYNLLYKYRYNVKALS